jgi:hypothetical protein
MVQGCESGTCGTCGVCLQSKRTTFYDRLCWLCVAIGFAMCLFGLFGTFAEKETIEKYDGFRLVSKNGKFETVFQSDSNLVTYDISRSHARIAIWESDTVDFWHKNVLYMHGGIIRIAKRGSGKDLFAFDAGRTLHLDDAGKLSVLQDDGAAEPDRIALLEVAIKKLQSERQIPGPPGPKGECSIPQQLLDRLQTVELELPILRKRLHVPPSRTHYVDERARHQFGIHSLNQMDSRIAALERSIGVIPAPGCVTFNIAQNLTELRLESY